MMILTVDKARNRFSRRYRLWYVIGIWLFTLSLLAGCSRTWETYVITPEGSEFTVNRGVLEDDLAAFVDEDKGVPLERVLWLADHYAIERLTLFESEGTNHEFDWPDLAEDAWWRMDGKVEIRGNIISPSRIEVVPPALLSKVQASITDIAPTVSAVLGLPIPSQSAGSALETTTVDQVLLLFLDGFGFMRYTEARDAGLIPSLSALPTPLLGVTEYLPSTRVGTAALLTGASSRVNGIDGRRTRNTAYETLFDVAAKAGLDVVAVEGEALSFNLRGADIILSGDRDGNASTDDNVLVNAMTVLSEGMPDIFFVHFHGIDDAGHTYGPGTVEEENAIMEVDTAVGQILAAIPADTLVIIFADHGMHLVEEEGRQGNHGHLITRDMFIPIFVTKK